MAILMILAGITMAGISNSSHNARKTSREIVRAHLQQARAHAIASRNPTAVIIPVEHSGTKGLRAMSFVEVEKTDGRYVPIRNENCETMLLQRWTQLPKNFHFVSNSMISSEQPTVTDHEATLAILHHGRELECHMLIFSPHGQITFPSSGEPIHIAIAQVASHRNTFRISEQSNGKPVFDLLQVNRLTAKTQIITP